MPNEITKKPLSSIQVSLEKLSTDDLSLLIEFEKTQAARILKELMNKKLESLKNISMNFLPLDELQRYLQGNRQGQRDMIEWFSNIKEYAEEELINRNNILKRQKENGG